jgi:hypothetical protein
MPVNAGPSMAKVSHRPRGLISNLFGDLAMSGNDKFGFRFNSLQTVLNFSRSSNRRGVLPSSIPNQASTNLCHQPNLLSPFGILALIDAD